MSPGPGPDLCYLDSSAIVKLIAAEPETRALHDWLGQKGPAVASVLARVEVQRAVNRLRGSRDLRSRAGQVLDRIALIRVDDAILSRATRIAPVELRTLDAIHLATALSVQDHLEAFVVYDRRLAEAAGQMGLEVVSPR